MTTEQYIADFKTVNITAEINDLSADERRLIHCLRSLTQEGQGILFKHARIIQTIPEYQKGNNIIRSGKFTTR